VQLGIEYAPEPPFDCGRPELARPEILAAVRDRLDRLGADRRVVARRAAQLDLARS
jgi:cyclohexyl-isocyanide hydratase